MATKSPAKTAAASIKAAVPPSPCKIKPDPTGQFGFQVNATAMPVKVKLCEDNHGAPATTSSFNTVEVFNTHTQPPQQVAGQPTGLTKTGFTLSLPVGTYDIVMVVNHLPGSQVAFVFEDCAGLNQLARIPIPLQPSGLFSLQVT